MTTGLRRLARNALPDLRRDAVDPDALEIAKTIIEDVRARGDEALLEHARRLGDLAPGAPAVHDRSALKQALDDIDAEDRALLERTAKRIRAFAKAQRDALGEARLEVPGGRAEHEVSPIQRAGCYAPGGRFPLPSSVLMTAVTARAAGVETVWVASPKPTPITLAAAAIADADGVLAVGGAQAIAALAYGTASVPACDIIVGPGNRFVTAAKRWVSGSVGIDMLAGPSELVVLSDGSGRARTIAADLLAQAEHDPDALPILVTTEPTLADAVDEEIRAQLTQLPTRETATAAVRKGFAFIARDLEEAIEVTNQLAPEHLELVVRNVDAVRPRLEHFGALFVGEGSAEVFGDYGAGPNHVLPTGGTSRFGGGLSVLTFLRVRTVLTIDNVGDAAELAEDARRLARLEGLEGHARSAEERLEDLD